MANSHLEADHSAPRQDPQSGEEQAQNHVPRGNHHLGAYRYPSSRSLRGPRPQREVSVEKRARVCGVAWALATLPMEGNL